MARTVRPGLSRGISYSVRGPCSPGESQLPGTVWTVAGSLCRGDGLGGLIREAPGIQPQGWWQPEEMLAAGTAPCPVVPEGMQGSIEGVQAARPRPAGVSP